ncbi:hypothetical protein PINS_up020854, partial [Pythium insidiosum]
GTMHSLIKQTPLLNANPLDGVVFFQPSTPSTMHSADECAALSYVVMFSKYHELGEGCSTMSTS